MRDPALSGGADPADLPEADPGADAGTFPSFMRWETFLSLGVTAALLAVLATQVDFALLLQDFSASNPWYLLLGFLAHYATYPVRGLRWRRSLGSLTHDTGAAKFGMIVFFYNAVDNVVPAKLGDLYAAHLARLNFRIRRSSALGSIVFLRLIDAWTVFLLAGICSWFVFSEHLPDGVAWVLGGGLALALVVTAGLVTMVLLRHSTPAWIPDRIGEMIAAFHDTLWPARKDLPLIAFWTAIIWALESLWIYCLVSAFGVSLSLTELIFLTQVPLLASAFPLTPSGAGAVEITLYGCLRLLSVPAPLAVSITVMNRLIDFWLHIVLGVLMWCIRRPLGIHSLRERGQLEPAPVLQNALD